MRVFQIICSPALWLLAKASSTTLRILGVTSESSGGLAHSEEELRLVVAESHRMGALSGEKRELLENIIDYTERTARHVMIPRADVGFLSLARSLEDNLAVITQTAHTRFPLASSDIDHVIGMVHVKDLFLHREGLRSSQDLVPLKREILFVPESRPLDALQREFQHSRTHMAMIVDEYGGTAGMLTLEDIIEEIVGEIQDEFDREPPKILETPQGLVFDGLTLIDEVCERLGITIDAPGEASTIGGFLGDRLGRIPRPGDRVQLGDHDLTVLEMNGRRVTRVLAVHRARPANAAEGRGR
jgi:CBS domain containing-hemolysin-like protein